MITKKNRSKSDIEWDHRTLCSDENCIGVIGPDGRCKECGKPFEGEFKPAAEVEEIAETDDELGEDTEETPEEDTDAYPEEDSEDKTDTDWENRTLCVDESCIGVIGPDGRCKECGKSLDDDAA